MRPAAPYPERCCWSDLLAMEPLNSSDDIAARHVQVAPGLQPRTLHAVFALQSNHRFRAL